MVANRRLRAGVLGLAVAAVIGGMGGFGKADTYTFTGSTGNWSDPAQWLGGNVPVNDPATQVVIEGTGTGGVAVNATVDAARPVWQVNGLTVTLPSGTPIGNQITIDPSSELQFVGSGAFLTQNSGSAIVISGPLDLASNLTVVGTGSGTLTLSGPVTGSGGIVIQNGFQDFLNGNNTFTGDVTLASGVKSTIMLNIGQPAALGKGNLIFDLGNNSSNDVEAIFQSAGATTTISNTIIIDSVRSVDGTFSTFFGGPQLVAAGVSSNQTYVFQHIMTNGNTTLALKDSSHKVTWSIGNLTLNGALDISGSTVNFGAINETAPSQLILDGVQIANFNGVNTTTGGLQINGAIVNANVAHSLGTSPIVNLIGGELHLNATNAAQNTVNVPILYYSANGAGGGNVLTANKIYIDNSVTSLITGGGTDVLNSTGGIIGSAATLALLDRGIGSGTTPNFIAASGSYISNADAGIPVLQNLGTNADLFLHMHTIVPTVVTLGAGTPWMGIAATFGTNGPFSQPSEQFVGTLVGNSAFAITGGVFGLSGTSGSFSILGNGGAYPVTIARASIESSLCDFSGASKFIVTGTLILDVANAMGGGNGTAPVPADVTSFLRISNSLALNGDVFLHGGASLQINAPGLNGTGVIGRDSSAITISVGDKNGFSGTQINTSFLQPGDTVSLGADDVIGLKNIVAGVNFIEAASEQAEGFNLNGVSLTFQNASVLRAGPTSQGNSTISIGPLGASLVNSCYISVPIIAQGPVDISGGFAAVLELSNVTNQFGAVSVTNATLISDSPAAITGANLTVNDGSGIVLLSASGPSSPTPIPTVTYSNPINVSGNVSISDYYNTGVGSVGKSVNPIMIASVNASAGNITLNVQNAGFSIGTLNVSGNLALNSNANSTITMGAITQVGIPPTSLTFDYLNPSGSFQTFSEVTYRITGNVAVAGPIVLGPAAGAEFDGFITPSTVPLTIGKGAELAGNGTIHRPVIFAPGFSSQKTQFLSPGTEVDTFSPQFGFIPTYRPGTLTVDSLVLLSQTGLRFNLGESNVIGGPNNDLVVVLGDLTLAGRMSLSGSFPLGTYTLFTYGGTLTYNGLAVPKLAGKFATVDLSVPGEVNLVITVTPEPVSLGVMLPAVLMLGRRRRR